MTSYLFNCFNQTCKKLIYYCFSLCGYNENCNCNCSNDNNIITQYCTIITSNNTHTNTNINDYRDLILLLLCGIFLCFICACLRTKIALKYMNRNMNRNMNIDSNINNDMDGNTIIDNQLPPYTQIDINPPPNYEIVNKTNSTIV